MHQEQHGAGRPLPPSGPSTLLAATIDFKDRVEFVEYTDGSVGIRIEEVEGNRIDPVLVRCVQRSERFPVSPAARLEDLGADLAALPTHLPH